MTSHLTSEQISNWMIGERLPEAERHVGECDACRAKLDRLQQTFGLFRDSARQWSDRCLRSAAPFDPVAAAAARRLPVWGGVMAAGIVVGALLLQRPSPAPAPAEEPFVPIPYVVPLAPYERTGVIRIDVSVAALTAAGFEVHGPNVDAAVKADVLIGQDGRAHAIRLVADSFSNSNRRLD